MRGAGLTMLSIQRLVSDAVRQSEAKYYPLTNRGRIAITIASKESCQGQPA